MLRRDFLAVTIFACREDHLPQWAILRAALWPDETVGEHVAEASALLAAIAHGVAFIAIDDDENPLGFAEASLQPDFELGCAIPPISSLDALYVVESARRRGITRALLMAIETWAEALGCTELVSEALFDDQPVQAAHATLGFAETQRVVTFRKALSDRSEAN